MIIKFKTKDLELTLDEAKALHEELNTLFPAFQTYISQPWIVDPIDHPWTTRPYDDSVKPAPFPSYIKD